MRTTDDKLEDLLRLRRQMVERFQIVSDMRAAPELVSEILQQINTLNERITAVAREAEENSFQDSVILVSD